MTNTLHRYGKSETFVDDYIVFSLPAKSKAAGQTGDALAAQKRFMQIAAEYKPASLGDALHGGSLRPTKSKSIFGHWGKRNKPNFKKVLEGIAEVKEGLSFCLSIPLDFPGGNVLNPRRLPPVLSPTGDENGWRYDAGKNAIVLDGYAVPGPGEGLEVRYYAWQGNIEEVE